MEEMLYDRLSFQRFCGFGLEADLPDATTILRFRSLLEGQSEKLLQLVNEELADKGITWSGGSIIGATVIESCCVSPPSGEQSPTDSEAGWTRKRGRYTYGYKAHISTTRKGLIRKAKATSADIHDSLVFGQLLDGSESKVYADKAYSSKKHRKFLKDHGIKDGILHKKPKGKEMHQILDELRLTLRPEKTFVGRNHKGFDLLGAHITPNGFSPKQKTQEKALEKAKRRYAQGDNKSLHLYLHRWRTWVHAGLPFLVQSVETVVASIAEKVTALDGIRTHRE